MAPIEPVKYVCFLPLVHEIAKMDAGIFFIKPAWSKRASSPTRLGEFLASGKPVLTNSKIGDVEEDVMQTRTGVVISDWQQDALTLAIQRLVSIAREPGIAERCRSAAEERFSLQRGIAAYAAIYSSLVSDSERRVD